MASDDELLAAARRAAERAWAPYSGVRVGAALLDGAGGVHVGCNVESASYGLTLCAERAAVARAVADGARDLRAVAIWSSLERPLAPCGACRQVLHEHAPGLRVVWEGAAGERVEAPLDALLPRAMGRGDLEAAGPGS